MTRKLPFLKSYRDRHGKVRHYLRMAGKATVALPGEYGTREFVDAYWAAREQASAPNTERGAERIIPGSISALVALYYQTKDFKGVQPKTRATYRGVLEKLRDKHGDKLVRGLRQRHIEAILDGLDANAVTWRKCLNLILKLAVARGWIDVNPMTGMRRSRKAKHGFRAWTLEDVAKYRAHWPTGTRERLALELLLYTAQRRGDVIAMGRQHLEGNQIRVAQAKSGGQTRLLIPLAAPLRAELAHVPAGQLTFLQTQYGQPFTANGFGNWFRDCARAAGLPERSNAHGLRKAAAAALAEAGCTDKQIMAITGHKNLSEVTLYTASADQERLAKQAIARLEKRTNRLPKPDPGRQNG